MSQLAVREAILRAKDKGYEKVILRNYFGPKERSDIAVVFKPEQIRSRWAKMNPRANDLNNLMAGLGGAVVLGGAAGIDDGGQ